VVFGTNYVLSAVGINPFMWTCMNKINSMKLALSCVFFLVATNCASAQTNPNCPAGSWSYFAKTQLCYQVYGMDYAMPAPAAGEFCNRFSQGHLATVDSDDTASFIVSK
jgi:hypothetical protein